MSVKLFLQNSSNKLYYMYNKLYNAYTNNYGLMFLTRYVINGPLIYIVNQTSVNIANHYNLQTNIIPAICNIYVLCNLINNYVNIFIACFDNRTSRKALYDIITNYLPKILASNHYIDYDIANNKKLKN